jgi:hypothetical protein
VPETVLGQLGNKVQHALRAFTPRDQKAVRAAADTFRQNPAFDTGKAILELAVGEALVSMLEPGGVPEMVERTLIAPPSARVGPLTLDERQAVIAASPLRGKYDDALDRESAYEMLAKRKGLPDEPAQGTAQSGGLGGILGRISDALGGGSSRAPAPPTKGGRQPMSITEMVIRSAAQNIARSLGTQIAREGGRILRNELGGIIGGNSGTRLSGGGGSRSGRGSGGDDLASSITDMLGPGR